MTRAVISAIGKDRPGIVSEISAIVHDINLSIADSRMTVLGGEFAMLVSVAGGALPLQRLETKLGKLAERMELAFLFRRTHDRENVEGRVPYTVSVTAMDHPGIVHRVAEFFSAQGINIYIDARLQCLDHQTQGAVPDASWLAAPGDPVNLVAYGIVDEPQAFDFAVWLQAPNPAFGARAPQQVIDDGTETERDHLADAIVALLDRAFS